MYYLRYAVVIFGVCWPATIAFNLPSYIRPCKRATIAETDCALKSAIAAIPNLIKGDTEFKIPPLSPAKIPKLELNSGTNLKLTLTDVSLLGLETIKFLKLKIDPGPKTVSVKFSIPLTTLIGHYDISGQILVLPITGTGRINTTFVDIECDQSYSYELVKKDDGKEYANIITTTMKTELISKGVHFHLENLFNGNKALSDNMNKVLNDNPQEVLRDVGYPLAKQATQYLGYTVISSILSNVPYDVLLPV